MQAVFEKLFDCGYRHTLLIGGDLPAVPFRFFEEAHDFLRLPEQRVVLGPSRDGGYFLVGCNRSTPQIFVGIDWSTGEVLAQTMANLAAFKIAYHFLPEWFDVDTPDDLLDLRAALSESLAGAMPRTARLLARLRVK
jgi:glycosyltransferase A (GT-A) superfamily protein (DUF2064 family)